MHWAPLNHHVDAFVNHDGTKIHREIEGAFAAAASRLEEGYFQTIASYSASTFKQLNLGKVLGQSRLSLACENGEVVRRFFLPGISG